MRQIKIRLNQDEEIIRLYATRGRRYLDSVTRIEAQGDITSRAAIAATVDSINYYTIETSCAIEV